MNVADDLIAEAKAFVLSSEICTVLDRHNQPVVISVLAVANVLGSMINTFEELDAVILHLKKFTSEFIK
jgi:uncharacterized protein YejL (UPF0352 family)